MLPSANDRELLPVAHVDAMLLTSCMSADPRDAQEAELSRLLDDASARHQYYYQPYTSGDQAGAASAPWRHQVRQARNAAGLCCRLPG